SSFCVTHQGREGDTPFSHGKVEPCPETNITGLPPYINTKKLTKPLLQVASKKKLKRGHWVHFSLENGRSAMLRRSAMLSRAVEPLYR
ncbi:MAG: hypothetical protein ACKPGT_25495, partial [Microcystis sp.]